jgi:hypothetical protein
VRGSIDRKRIDDTSVSQALQPLSNSIVTHIKGIVGIQLRIRPTLCWRPCNRRSNRPCRMIDIKISKRILGFLDNLLSDRRWRLL